MLGGAIFTITRRSAVHSAIPDRLAMGVAGLYLLQQAEFLFAVQIVLYIGGIMVLFLFVIMLVNLDEAAKERQFNGQWWMAFAVWRWWAALRSLTSCEGRGLVSGRERRARCAGRDKGNTEALADVLFSQYLLPFEIASRAAAGGRGRLGGDGEEEDLTWQITEAHYLVLSVALLLIGTVGVLTRRNIVIILMSIELILNAVNINLIAFSQAWKNMNGQIFAIFVITDAVAEAAVGLGILIALFRNKETVLADEVDLLKW